MVTMCMIIMLIIMSRTQMFFAALGELPRRAVHALMSALLLMVRQTEADNDNDNDTAMDWQLQQLLLHGDSAVIARGDDDDDGLASFAVVTTCDGCHHSDHDEDNDGGGDEHSAGVDLLPHDAVPTIRIGARARDGSRWTLVSMVTELLRVIAASSASP